MNRAEATAKAIEAGATRAEIEAVVAALETGQIAADDVLSLYSIDSTELAAWQRDSAMGGRPALRTTRLQKYGFHKA